MFHWPLKIWELGIKCLSRVLSKNNGSTNVEVLLYWNNKKIHISRSGDIVSYLDISPKLLQEIEISLLVFPGILKSDSNSHPHL